MKRRFTDLEAVNAERYQLKKALKEISIEMMTDARFALDLHSSLNESRSAALLDRLFEAETSTRRPIIYQ